jgi:gliding motility-associated lipoprotein GldD
MKNRHNILILGLIASLLLISSCNSDDDDNYTPKPKAYLRLDLPTPAYIRFDTLFPFSFEYASIARIQPDMSKNSEPYWINIEYPTFGAMVYLSYKRVNHNLEIYKQDAVEFANKHIQQADDIQESYIKDTTIPIIGKIFEIKGVNVACPYQFWVSDSSSKFLRGALYFNTKPNNDSLAPIINFVKRDMMHLINTFKWNDKIK